MKKTVFVMVTALALLAALLHPLPAHADGGTPTSTSEPDQPTGTVTETLPPTETPVPSPTDEPLPADIPFASDSPIADPTPILDNAADTSSLTETLAELPTETELVVLDENGQPLPLAAQQAAETIAYGDPMWCPVGTLPGDSNCFSNTSLQDLINYLSFANLGTGINSDGTIWIESSYTSATNDPAVTGFALDGNVLTTWAKHSLTLQGGWSGTSGDTTIGSNPIFTVPISISNWVNDITINNITVDGGTGSILYMNNNVTVNDSSFNNSSGPGLQVNSNFGDLTINNSEFNNNIGPDGTGLFVNLNGAITLNNISANNNSQMGAHIRSYGDKDVILSGNNNTFIGNKAQGLDIANTLNGNITVENVVATGNGENIPNYYSVIIQAIDGGITLSNIVASNNKSSGIYVSTRGNVTLQSITASGNAHKGIETYSVGATSLTDVTADNNGGVNEYGIYTYSHGDIALHNITVNDNGMYGVISTSTNGNITLINITANRNPFIGVIASAINGYVLIDTVSANENGALGLYISSNGNTTMDNITATLNGESGIFVFTPGNATINATDIQNNGLYGVDASSVCGTFSINGSFNTINPPVKGKHTFTNFVTGQNIEIYCTPKVYVNGVLVYGEQEPVLADQYEFELSCATQRSYLRTLTNGDQVQIICPVSGTARIQRLDNTMLPADLPPGYSYASAFSLDIIQNEQPILYIKEGGHVKASFEVHSTGSESMYSVLYWDAERQAWMPLKSFIIDANGNPRTFPLYPDDPRLILSGLNFVTEDGVLRAEISTNFPGTFVLVQQ